MNFLETLKTIEMPSHLMEAISAGYTAIFESEKPLGDMTAGDLLERRETAPSPFKQYVEAQQNQVALTMKLGGACKNAQPYDDFDNENATVHHGVNGTIGDREVPVSIENFGNSGYDTTSEAALENGTKFHVSTNRADGSRDYKDIFVSVDTFNQLDIIFCAMRIDAPRFVPTTGETWEDWEKKVNQMVREHNHKM